MNAQNELYKSIISIYSSPKIVHTKALNTTSGLWGPKVLTSTKEKEHPIPELRGSGVPKQEKGGSASRLRDFGVPRQKMQKPRGSRIPKFQGQNQKNIKETSGL